MCVCVCVCVCVCIRIVVLKTYWGRRDCMVVRFITTYAIIAYHHWCYEFEFHSGEVYPIQHYVIKFVSNLWQVGGFLRVLRFLPPIKPIKQTNKQTNKHVLTIWDALRVAYKMIELFTSREHLGSLLVFGGVSVAHLFTFLCCAVSCVSSFPIVSGLSILSESVPNQYRNIYEYRHCIAKSGVHLFSFLSCVFVPFFVVLCLGPNVDCVYGLCILDSMK